MLTSINKLDSIFSGTGALTYRLGSIITGKNIGNELLAGSYRSMGQLDKAYDLVVNNLDYGHLVDNVTVNSRNIIKLEF